MVDLPFATPITKTDKPLAVKAHTVRHFGTAAHAPIGLFDSGVGGLSVYQHLQHKLPNEQYVYYADTMHVPYGSRSCEQIRQLTLTAIEWLVSYGCKLIVIACNSASAHALTHARKRYPHIPIVGLVPAIKPAVLASRSRHIAVVATQATLNGHLLNEVIDTIATPNHTKVSKWFEPSLVPWVEAGMPANSPTAHILKQQLHYFYMQEVDQLVLGCTHYPFFRPFVDAEITQQGWNMHIIDSGFAIANRVYDLLTHQGSLQQNQQDNTLIFYATKPDTSLSDVIQRLISQPVQLMQF